MPLDHILLRCSANILVAEIAFLNAALAPLGIKENSRIGSELFAFGDEQNPRFLLASSLDRDQQPIKSHKPLGIHIVFKAKDKAEVDAFYDAALAAGGKDDGAPSVRKGYPAGYYVAFVISPGGNNVEALVHDYFE